MARSAVVAVFFILLINAGESANNFTGGSIVGLKPAVNCLCADVIQRYPYSCSDHKVQTKDGYILGLHRVSSHADILREQRGPPVLLLHGLFMAGDAWFLDSVNQSLGYILVDHGFDVWAASVRGTRWSYGHISLSEEDKEFWDWSWEELALYDLAAMLHYVNLISSSKVFIVGHSQGTIMSLATFTELDIIKMVEGAALLAPISYLKHVSAPLVLTMVGMHLDQVVRALGIYQLNFKSEILGVLCDGYVDCGDVLTSVTVIRKGTFAKYDYGFLRNLMIYGQFRPPKFDLSRIPKSLPLWMACGGNDALADTTDLVHTLKELKSKPELLYLENYGHVDFLLSVSAKRDVYDSMIGFFRSLSGKPVVLEVTAASFVII